jgi:hypothetical protein
LMEDTKADAVNSRVHDDLFGWIEDDDQGQDTINGPVSNLNKQHDFMRYSDCDFPRTMETVDTSPFGRVKNYLAAQTPQMIYEAIQERVNTITDRQEAFRFAESGHLLQTLEDDVIMFSNDEERPGRSGVQSHLEEQRVLPPDQPVMSFEQPIESILNRQPFRDPRTYGWRR